MMMRLTAAALVLVSFTQNCKSESSCSLRTPPNFYMAKNRAFQNFTYQSKRRHQLSVTSCGRDCALDPRCASFNYRSEASYYVCDLNNAARDQSPVDLLELGGSYYFDKNADTLLCSAPYDVDRSSCQMLLRAGNNDSGIYKIFPAGRPEGVKVYCDMETDGGGWMVFQRRQDGSVDFYRNWAEYCSGFGNPSGEFWLGNDLLRNLTASGKWQLIVDLGDWDGNAAWAEYGEFSLSGQNCKLHVGSYNTLSTAKDSLAIHDGALFTTKDRDNDVPGTGNCAYDYSGAWWFTLCHQSHLNGKYLGNVVVREGHGVIWGGWKGYHYSLKKCSMKVREVSCYNRLI